MDEEAESLKGAGARISTAISETLCIVWYQNSNNNQFRIHFRQSFDPRTWMTQQWTNASGEIKNRLDRSACSSKSRSGCASGGAATFRCLFLCQCSSGWSSCIHPSILGRRSRTTQAVEVEVLDRSGTEAVAMADGWCGRTYRQIYLHTTQREPC